MVGTPRFNKPKDLNSVAWVYACCRYSFEFELACGKEVIIKLVITLYVYNMRLKQCLSIKTKQNIIVMQYLQSEIGIPTPI